mgnify:CR=1 FL=1
MEILMVRPYQFYFNQQTAANNFFQSNINIENANELAIAEFDAMVEKLRAHQIKVNVVQDTKDPSTPDSIFPNNWVSTHTNGTLCLYPMFAQNRRAERKSTVINFLQSNYKIENTLDLTDLEKEGIFLEGTGSMVLDHQNKLAYGCLSERLDKNAFYEWCDKMQFKAIAFKAVDDKAQPIYHTNVMMCIGDTFAVICADCIDDKKERKMVLDSLKGDEKEVILITEDQVNNFAGNMLEVKGNDDRRYLIMSASAHQSLTKKQIAQLEEHVTIVSSSLDTIEACGGGSARCMMAEIFLPRE